jgi:hypothetical protein
MKDSVYKKRLELEGFNVMTDHRKFEGGNFSP